MGRGLSSSRPGGTRPPALEVKTAPEMGWAGISNGRLLDLAEQDGFDLMVTSDTNIRFQNRLAGRRIALVVATTNHWIRSGPIRQTCMRHCGSGSLHRGRVSEAATAPAPPPSFAL